MDDRQYIPLFLSRIAILLGLISLLSACGGGDKQASPPPPVISVNAGYDRAIVLTDTLNLNATVTQGGLPPQGNVVYAWSMSSGPASGVANFNDTSIEDPSVTFTATGSYVLSLSVNIDGEVASDTLTVTVSSVASSIQVDAGLEQTIVLADTLNLNATVTQGGLPPQGNVVYTWSMSSGPASGVANFNDTSIEDPSVSFTATGSYVLTLAVDIDGEVASDTLEVTVNLKAAGSSGLAARPSNVTECVAPASAPVASSILLETPYPDLPTLTAPLAMYMAPGDSSSWYVVQQSGEVIKFANNAAVNTVSTFIDISGRITYSGERGLLGMAFHPDFATNGYVYLSYTRNYPAPTGLLSRVSRFSLTGAVLDPASEVPILEVSQPYDNHNGGQISFGPDGYLYIGLGDGGSAGDPLGNGQDTTTLLGAMLRIDVGDGTLPPPPATATYSIPPDNPFVSGGGLPEIFAYGLRNPWRWSFDRVTNELWVGDVGQNEFEEIDIINSGANYGWNTMEGFHCYNAATCDQTGLTLPVAEYDHTQGFSVTGGYVYRGTSIAFLQGHYIYADYVSGRIWGFDTTGTAPYTGTELLSTGFYISSFAEDHSGELYVLNMVGGSIHKIAENTAGQGTQIPTLLSGWGCFQAADTKAFSTNVIPFDINALLWSDNANKGRFMAIPDGTTIDVDGEGRLVYPVGSVLGKHFYLDTGQIIETRLLLHHEQPAGWKGYSYEWNDTQTDATLLTSAKNKSFASQTWHYPSSAECDACHTTVAGFTLGPEIGQLNRLFDYSGTIANQLITLESIGVLTSALTEAEKDTTYYAIDDLRYSSELRARSYLHSNCASCHQPGGTGGGNMDLRMATPLADTGICNQAPLGDTLGLVSPVILAPGDPDSSILVLRMEDSGQYRMPPLGTAEIDTQAMSVIRNWITDMPACP